MIQILSLKTSWIACLIFLVFNTSLISQETTTITGQVLDARAKQPIELVSIFLYNNQSQGTITNQTGQYAFTFSEEHLSDSLAISMIGYETSFISLESLTDSIVNIQLKPSLNILTEVMIVHNEGMKNLVRKAFELIPENIELKPHDQQAFYQNYTISDSAYAELIEANVTIRKKKYNRNKNDFKVYINELRKSDDQRNLPERVNKFIGHDRSSLHRLLQLDGVSNNCINCKFKSIQNLNKQLSLLEFSGYSETLRGNDTIALITFFNNMFILHTPEGPKKLMYGEIAINKTNFAIERIKNGILLDEYPYFQEVGYRPINGKYYLSYIKNSIGLEFDHSTRSLVNSEILSIEGHRQVKGKIKKRYLLKENKHLRNFKLDYNNDYWLNKKLPVSATPLETMMGDLSRMSNLQQQFKNNEKRKGS